MTWQIRIVYGQIAVFILGHLSGGDIVVAVQLDVQEALVIAQIQINLTTILQDVNFAWGDTFVIWSFVYEGDMTIYGELSVEKKMWAVIARLGSLRRVMRRAIFID